MIGLRATKPLRRARLWLGLWWGAIALVVVASLLPATDLPPLFPGADKFEHFLSYAGLGLFAVQLFEARVLLRVGVALVALGIATEFAQYLFTSTRMMEAADALANTLGVAAGLLSTLTPLAGWLQRMDARPR